MKEIRVKACVLGAGSGGFGCVYRLAKNGISVACVDRNSDFGGNSVFGGVSCWEPGVSLEGVHTLLKDKLSEIKDGCCVAKTVPNCNLFGEDRHTWDYPWGLSVPCDDPYESTLKRCGLDYFTQCRRFQFEEAAMSKAMNSVLEPYKEFVKSFFGYKLIDAYGEDKSVKHITISNGIEDIIIFADYFVDSSGSIVMARQLGCEVALGCEDRAKYNEPSAPERASDSINGVSYVFRVSKIYDSDYIDKIPYVYLSHKLGNKSKTVACFNCYPNGDININMLPTMEGKEYLKYGNKADFYGNAAVWKYWNYLQKHKKMSGYTLNKIFGAGVRESYRIVGKYVLTENDLRNGILKQANPERMIAVADHALDVHGKEGSCSELKIPYAIPLDCCVAKEYNNLYVACMGASFSHIAASSARLSRTMLSLGEGVGEYIAETVNKGSYKNIVQGNAFKHFVNNFNF